MEEEVQKLALQVNYNKEIGSFSIINYEKQKQAFVDYINGLKVETLTNDIDRKKYTNNRATLNKIRDKVKSQRIATTKLIDTQFKEIEKLVDTKSKEFDKEVKRYDSEQEAKKATEVIENTEVVVGKTETHKLVLNGSKTALEQVLAFAQTLGLQGEIE